MKLCSYLRNGQERHAVIDGGHLLEIRDRNIGEILQKLASGAHAGDFPTEKIGRPNELVWLPPVPNPQKVFCLGYNFRTHATEMDRKVPEYPTLFSRFADSLVGHEQPIWRPTVSETLDWEGELAVVIGKTASRIPPDSALEYVAGYTCFGDHSVREFQSHSTQATAGKNFRRTGSFGPWLVSRDEIPDVVSLSLTTRINGTVMQQASLAEMIFGVEQTLSYISQFTDLHPGDVIAMGTPSGVGMRKDPPLWLKEGDLVEVEIGGIGVLANRVVNEPA